MGLVINKWVAGPSGGRPSVGIFTSEEHCLPWSQGAVKLGSEWLGWQKGWGFKLRIRGFLVLKIDKISVVAVRLALAGRDILKWWGWEIKLLILDISKMGLKYDLKFSRFSGWEGIYFISKPREERGWQFEFNFRVPLGPFSISCIL